MRYQLTSYELLKQMLANLPEGDDCVEWPRASRNKQKYGSIRMAGATFMTHRAAYILTHGAIPSGQDVLHRCDNPKCFRPSHLFLGDHTDNMRDCAAKGRIGCTRTLTVDQVNLIRELHFLGARNCDIANSFHISRPTVSYIVRRKTWKLA